MAYPTGITPEYVSSLEGPTDGFLCPLSANVYKIDFVAFKIRAMHDDTETVLFEIKKEPDVDDELDDDDDPSVRTIQYHFGPEFLRFQTIGTTLEFTVGPEPVTNFRMIERHYFRNRLLRSYDFTLPFCIPQSMNTWEVIYSMPELSPEDQQDIINNPWETKSDSFYFVDGVLVMHNKAEYSYAPH
mmetsp:Transcript_27778/g.71912  ORF Transcript_27778/g.71912 Transcript_27778/m.71912 type:complete len:186 (+) Transcript_27778:88-645(+)